MALFLEGLGFGLILAISLGPIFIVTIQTALSNGKKAGFIVTSGVWLSDLIFISASYFFISKIDHIVRGEGFEFWMSIVGGIILCLFGIVSFLKKSKFNKEQLNKKTSLKSISAYFAKGFLVNTVNPFTFIFWLGIMSTNVIGRNLSVEDSIHFLSAILISIVLSDCIKVLLADWIRTRMNQFYFNLVTKIAGIGLFVIGLYLLYQGLVN